MMSLNTIEKLNILSFDIEEWPFYKENGRGEIKDLDYLLNSILDLLDQHNFKATFFCLGRLSREFPDVIKLIDRRGHEIGCHSDAHKWLTAMSRDEFTQDTMKAIQSLEDSIGKKVNGYRAPAFSITSNNKWVIEILAENGIVYDSSIFPTARDFGGFPEFTGTSPIILEYNGIKMKEFPISTTTILGKKLAYSGGGYFRLFPYAFLKNTMSERDYNMTYFHMHDFNTKEKRVISHRYFKAYYGISGTMRKFEKMLDTFHFMSCQEADLLINWDHHIDL